MGSETTPTTTVATFGTTSYREVVTCRVCGRSLLMGERSTGFFTASGEGPFDVCDLCVPRAGKFGLRPQPSTADEVARSRRRRTWRLGKLRLPRMGELVARVPVPTRPRSVASMATMRRGIGEHTAALLGATAPVGPAAIPAALATFNSSRHARTLAGLCKTLGQPRASVVPRSATDREVIVTVAWEIVWYQFRIMLDGIEQRQGTYLADLPQRWQRWNCVVHPDGSVHEQGSDIAGAGHIAPATHPLEMEGSTP